MDGLIDFSTYSLQQLREAAASIDCELFPVNFAQVREELQRRGEVVEVPPLPVAAARPVAALPRVSSPPILGAMRAFWLFIAYVLVQLGVGLLGGMVIGIYGAMQGWPQAEILALTKGQSMFPIVLATMISGGFVTFWMARRSFPGALGERALAPLGWAPISLKSAAAATLCGALLSIVYLLVAGFAMPPAPTQEFGEFTTAAVTAVGLPRFWWVFCLLVAAPVEEFLFRGAMFAGFTRSFGPIVAGIIVTVLFVTMHLPEIYGYYPAIVAIAALGTLALVARHWTGSLVAPICIHATYNLVIALSTIL